MSEQQPPADRPAAAATSGDEPPEVAGLLAAVRQRYPALDDQAAEVVRASLIVHRRMLQTLRGYPLSNADEPDLTFSAGARD